MAVDNEIVKNIAYLSRIKVEQDKLEETKTEFNKILAWVEELNEVNVDNIQPLISVHEDPIVLREDVVTVENSSNDVLANAPQKEFGYFAVPKVVE
jgi:aspartyl-tRNA(Asn)/glutamyl-tRNA(Gln) amidotransferase subunit C